MRNIIFFIALSFSCLINAGEIAKKYDASHSWFQPHLSLNKSPSLCESALKDLKNYFISSVTGSFFDQPSFWGTFHPVIWQQNSIGFDVYQTDLNGVKIKFAKKEDSWSGAAIRYQQIVIVPDGFEETRENYRNLFEKSALLQDRYDSVDLAVKEEKLFLVAKERYLEDKYQIFEIGDETNPTLICEAILSEPVGAGKNKDVEAVSSLLDTVHQIIGPEGDCGTLHAQSGHVAFMDKAFADSLARPWAIIAGSAGGDLDGNLYRWSLGGISENKLYQQYKKQLVIAERELTEFYIINFKLKKLDASVLAYKNLADSIDSGFAFSSSWYPPHIQSSADILSGAKIDKIKEGLISSELTPESAPDLLFLSVERPEVVALLLSEGWSPNVTNGFGKTPLMEAAQYDALESARLLLSHGASVESSTYGPTDRCSYQLDTMSLTALHYAVRYGSKALIELLLENNAPTYFKDSRSYREAFTPYDYLVKFGGEISYDGKISGLSWGQKNRKLTEADLEILKSRLMPPEKSNLLSIAKGENLRGESEYARGDMLKAYGAFIRALAADPENIRVLTNLSLVAMKLGRSGEAAKYANAVITSNQASSHERASAYFNMGRICEKNGFISYDQYYCRDIPAEYFLRSYQLEPNEVREKAIVDFFVSDTTGGHYCDTANILGNKLAWIYLNGTNSYAMTLNESEAFVPKSINFRDGSGEKSASVIKTESISLVGRNAKLVRLTTSYQLGWQNYVDFGAFICRKGQRVAEPKL